MTTLLNYAALRAYSVFTTAVQVQGYATAGDGGQGTFYWDKNTTEPDNDGTIIRHRGNNPPSKGAWKRFMGDAVNVRWFGAKNNGSANAAAQIKNALNAAIHIRAKVSFFAGTYQFDEGIEIDIPDNFHLIIEGNNALIKASAKVTAAKSEVNLLRFFTSAGLDTKGTGVFMDSLNFDGGTPKAQFTEGDINAIKRLHTVVAEDLYAVSIKHCNFKNIQGTGTKALNFVQVNFDNLKFDNVGGKFHLENDFDSFGDGIYLRQTNLETTRASRKQSNATIANCHILAYDPLANGNYASRCGICIEGFNTLNTPHRVTVKVSNCTISGYDRIFHVEGIETAVTADTVSIKNFQCIYLLNYGRSTSVFNNCHISDRLPDNPGQVRLGNGGTMTYPANLPNHIAFNQCQVNVKASAVFIGQLAFTDTVFDYGNHDLLFENSTIAVNKSKFINIPHNLPRNLNFYSCTFSALNSTFQGYKNGNDNSGGILHFENLDLPSFANNTIIDTHLVFTFRPAATPAQLSNNKIYRNPKGTGAKMDALINFNNIPQVKMSNNQFFITIATAADEEPIIQTYGVQKVIQDQDVKHLHTLSSGKTVDSVL